MPKTAPPAVEATWSDAPQFAPLTTSFDAAATAAQATTASRGPIVEATPLKPLVQIQSAAPVAQSVSAGVFEKGIAIIYGDEFDGLPTSNGEIFRQTGLTAAHPSLPLPSLVAVTNPATGREVVVRVNDRGPFHGSRVIDLAHGAAQELGLTVSGVAQVKLEVLP